MSAILCAGVDVRYGTTLVLRDADLAVERGERVALTGANGAGKTTLLRVLAGLLSPDRGRVEVLGAHPRDPATRRRMGHLGHVPHLYPRLSARENVRFWAGAYGVRASGAHLLDALGIDPADRRPASDFSQGMRRRIGLACALVHAPDVLLVDEPFAGLDAVGADAVAKLLSEGSRTLLLATHERDLADRICSRTVAVEAGTLREAAPRP